MLGRTDSISIVPKRFLPEVIRNIGSSGRRIAAVLTQNPDELGLRGYDRKLLHMNISTMGPDGERVVANVQRYVVQLGWGRAVEQQMVGEEVPMLFTMSRFQARFPEILGWPMGPLPASLVITEISKHIPSEAVAEIQPRQDDSVRFLVHSDYSDHLLRCSGKSSVFFKEADAAKEFFLLWLDDGTSLEEAVKLADHQSVFGVVRKGSAASPKYAIRFREQDKLQEFAASNAIYDSSSLARWKIQGVDCAVGTYGLLAWLTQRRFQDVEMLYMSENSGVWLATQPGNLSPGFYIQNGVRRQFFIKAFNQVAREQAKPVNISSAASKSSASAPGQ